MGAAIPLIAAADAGFSGFSQGQAASQQIAHNYTQAKRALADQEALAANQLSRQSQTNPLRDQAIYQLSGMLGASPAAFNPTSFLTPSNSGTQGVGGVNLNALAQRAAQYTPGAGGVNSNVTQMALNRMGYGNTGTGTLFDTGSPNASPPPTPPDQLTGKPGATQTTGATIPGGGTPAGQNPQSAAIQNAYQQSLANPGQTVNVPNPWGLTPANSSSTHVNQGATNALQAQNQAQAAANNAAPGTLTYAQRLRQLPIMGGGY